MIAYKYHLYRSRRKTVSIEIKDDSSILVRAPLKMSVADIDRIVQSKQNWLAKHLQKIQQKNTLPFIQVQDRKRFAQILLGRIQVMEQQLKIAGYPGPYPVTYRVRTFKSQWGNCKSNGTITFNCYAYYLPEDLLWYLFVHEISHLREMNHGSLFWQNVRALLPDWQEKRQQLKAYCIPREKPH